MRIIALLFCLLITNTGFCIDDYLKLIQQQVLSASNAEQKIKAYEKWLPLSILTHDPNTKNDLDSLKKIVGGNKSELGTGIYNLNMAYYLVENYGDYNKGLEYCLMATTIFEKLNAKPQLVMAYNRLAFLVLWNQIGKKDALLKENLNEKYLSKALTIAKEINDKNLQILTLGYIGSYYNVTENNGAKALSYFFESEKLIDSKTPPDLKLTILESISIVYADLFEEKEMLTYLNKCEALSFFKNFGYGQSNMYRAVAKMYMLSPTNKDLNKALQYANKAYNISLTMNAPEYITQGEQRLYEIYKAMGDKKTALYYHEKYRLHEDSLARERFQQTYSEYDVLKKEATIKTLELNQLKSKNDKNNLIASGLLLLLFAGATFGIYIFRSNRKLRHKNEELSQKNEEIEKALVKGQTIERKRVAADLHDTLGVQANAILHNTERLKNDSTDKEGRIDFLHETAKEMLLNLRETLWAMKTNDIAAVDLWLRIVNFCKQMSRHYKTIQISTSGLPPSNIILDSPKALNIVMIIQEAVNNAIKHAKSSSIIVNTSYDEKTIWQISIVDNGDGFDEKAALQKHDAFGLTNMRERAFASGVHLQINSILETGTTIQLKIV